MNSLTLFNYRRCPFAIRVRMVLEWKGLKYEKREEDLSDLSKELLALHPEGRVPLLIHRRPQGDAVIFQSTIITEYLDETFPQKSLMPVDSFLKAQVRLLTYSCDSSFKPDLDVFKYERQTLNDEQRIELESRLHQTLSSWNDRLLKNQFLIGKEVTLADVHVFPLVRQFLAIKPELRDVGQYTALFSWTQRIAATPWFEAVMTKPTA